MLQRTKQFFNDVAETAAIIQAEAAWDLKQMGLLRCYVRAIRAMLEGAVRWYYCRWRGHRWEVESWANPETAGEYFSCQRCGESHTIHYY